MWYACISGLYIHSDLSRDLKGCFFPGKLFFIMEFYNNFVRSNNALSTNAAEGTGGILNAG